MEKNKRVLVIGDLIMDSYHYCTTSRLCPEAPIPVLTPLKDVSETRGGAGLVAAQLQELQGVGVEELYGSRSRKERYFCDGRLVCRVDYDSISTTPDFHKTVISHMRLLKPELLIISDYGKGAITEKGAREIMEFSWTANILVFIDAKNHWEWYGDYANLSCIFPNEHENIGEGEWKRVVRKLGAKGCLVNGQLVSTNAREARDTTGAGDVFLAAFAHAFLLNSGLTRAAEYGNLVAGISVEHIGTHVVTKDEIT